MLLTIKSSKSSIPEPAPSGCILLQILNPKTQGIDSSSISIQLITQALALLIWNKSLVQDIIFSNTASTVDIAANDINTKNKLPHNLPSGMWLNILGRVINISTYC